MKNLIIMGILGMLLVGCESRPVFDSQGNELKPLDNIVLIKDCLGNTPDRLLKKGDTGSIKDFWGSGENEEAKVITNEGKVFIPISCIEKVTETPVEPKKEAKFKVGDKVQVINEQQCGLISPLKNGDKYTITKLEQSPEGKINYVKDSETNFCQEKGIELFQESKPIIVPSKYEAVEEYLSFQKLCKKYNKVFKSKLEVVINQDSLTCGKIDQKRIELELGIIEEYLKANK